MPTPPWIRVGLAGAAALVFGGLVAWEGGTDVAIALSAGAAGALALAAALLTHEVAWQIPALSLALRSLPCLSFFLRSPPFGGRYYFSVTPIQLAPTALELTALALACGVAAAVHARRRCAGKSNRVRSIS